MHWLLPEYIQDGLPERASRLEHLRRALLDYMYRRGYLLVRPPLIEYLDSLLTGVGQDLRGHTFQMLDQLSGKMLGVRADITPQVSRIDAHLLNHAGVTRLCYCGTTLQTEPLNQSPTREPLQFGGEIFGHAGLEADIEVIRVMADSLKAVGVEISRIELSHVGLFKALCDAADLNEFVRNELFYLLQVKDVSAAQDLLENNRRSNASAMALINLARLYGDAATLQKARELLPDSPAVTAALDELQAVIAALGDLPVYIDLADLRGLDYHTGIVFAAYHSEASSAIARGGRYDNVGRAFGRERPATGFSLCLKTLADLLQPVVLPGAVLAPVNDGNHEMRRQLEQSIANLRAAGEVVVEELPGHAGTWADAGCNRRLQWVNGQWQTRALVSGE